jgi:hypothetical protein
MTWQKAASRRQQAALLLQLKLCQLLGCCRCFTASCLLLLLIHRLLPLGFSLGRLPLLLPPTRRLLCVLPSSFLQLWHLWHLLPPLLLLLHTARACCPLLLLLLL